MPSQLLYIFEFHGINSNSCLNFPLRRRQEGRNEHFSPNTVRATTLALVIGQYSITAALEPHRIEGTTQEDESPIVDHVHHTR